MYVTKPRLFFDYALRNRFSVPSFNVCNLEIARAVIRAAEAEDAPVILQTYFGDLYYGGFDVLPKLLRLLAEQAKVPVLVHQDHPDADQMILRTLRAGYYSVMYDGGHLPLERILKEQRTSLKSRTGWGQWLRRSWDSLAVRGRA